MGQALTKAEILTPISTGTPRRWDTPEQLISEANKYLVDCRAEDRPFTLVGLRCEMDVAIRHGRSMPGETMGRNLRRYVPRSSNTPNGIFSREDY